jgi:hypothetical protein
MMKQPIPDKGFVDYPLLRVLNVEPLIACMAICEIDKIGMKSGYVRE